MYEQASGAKLNVQKSSVISLGVPLIPQWLQNIGCQIQEPRDILKYLGAPLGYKVPSQKIIDFCLDRVCTRILGWQTKHISFAGRLILIRQIAQAIPTYHLMYTHFTKGQVAALQRLCRLPMGCHQRGDEENPTHFVGAYGKTTQPWGIWPQTTLLARDSATATVGLKAPVGTTIKMGLALSLQSLHNIVDPSMNTQEKQDYCF